MKRPGLSYAFMLVLLVVAMMLSLMVRQGRAIPPRKDFSSFPMRLGDWRGTDLGRFPDEIMEVLKVSDYLNRTYSNGVNQASLYIGYYRTQRAGESLHSPKNCLPGSGWEVLESRQVSLEIPSANKRIEVNHYVVQNGPDRQLVLYWYDTHGRAYANEFLGKAILVWEALRTGRNDGALIRIMVPFGSSAAQAETVASDFARQVYPLLKEYLPE